MRRTNLLMVFAFAGISSAFAQGFSSSSTGADGALNITSNTTLQLPASGTFNYTTVNVASGATLSFALNATNTPVTMLATGAVTISGTISLNASGVRGNRRDLRPSLRWM